MIKQLLEKKLGRKISDSELKESLEMATDDIKFNRIGFKKITHLQDTLLVVEQCLVAGNLS